MLQPAESGGSRLEDASMFRDTHVAEFLAAIEAAQRLNTLREVAPLIPYARDRKRD